MMRRRLPVLMILPALLLGPWWAPTADADEARWSRSLVVEKAGTLKVELPGRVAERALVDLELSAPDGSLVASRLHSADPREKTLPATVTRVSPRADGYRVELDAGAAPPPHQGLRFDLVREARPAAFCSKAAPMAKPGAYPSITSPVPRKWTALSSL
ncbi:MAG: hypothetical protein HC821_01305 [Lewinella sp.]|nr:hypothetical protein [Lewinella sp.]